MSKATSSEIENLIAPLQVSAWGLTPLQRPHSFDFYRQWIDEGRHGDMEYLKLHLPAKEEPRRLLPQARSAIVVAVDYRPHPHPQNLGGLHQLKIASYAKGKDYHFWLKQCLEEIIAKLKQRFPQDVFLAMTDTHPVLERELAHRAGLGWFGKNTCLIDNRRGSFFLIGEIYSSLDVQASLEPPPDLCGTCDRCLKVCPTEALVSPKLLDATKCISYWTIESRQVPPEPLRRKIGEWFFGCDICQQVCPWNEKALGRELLRSEVRQTPDLAQLEEEICLILSSSNNSLLKLFAGTPLTRPGGRGLKRNAILVAVHHDLKGTAPLIRKAGEDYPDLKELSDWAWRELKPDSAG